VSVAAIVPSTTRGDSPSWAASCQRRLQVVRDRFSGTQSQMSLEAEKLTYEFRALDREFRVSLSQTEPRLTNRGTPPKLPALAGSVPRRLPTISSSGFIGFGARMLAYQASVMIVGPRFQKDAQHRIEEAMIPVVTECLADAERSIGNRRCEDACPSRSSRDGRTCDAFCFFW
jgi:hypothetical protein